MLINYVYKLANSELLATYEEIKDSIQAEFEKLLETTKFDEEGKHMPFLLVETTLLLEKYDMNHLQVNNNDDVFYPDGFPYAIVTYLDTLSMGKLQKELPNVTFLPEAQGCLTEELYTIYRFRKEVKSREKKAKETGEKSSSDKVDNVLDK